jgi:hypothetical protein
MCWELALKVGIDWSIERYAFTNLPVHRQLTILLLFHYLSSTIWPFLFFLAAILKRDKEKLAVVCTIPRPIGRETGIVRKFLANWRSKRKK